MNPIDVTAVQRTSSFTSETNTKRKENNISDKLLLKCSCAFFDTNNKKTAPHKHPHIGLLYKHNKNFKGSNFCISFVKREKVFACHIRK